MPSDTKTDAEKQPYKVGLFVPEPVMLS